MMNLFAALRESIVGTFQTLGLTPCNAPSDENSRPNWTPIQHSIGDPLGRAFEIRVGRPEASYPTYLHHRRDVVAHQYRGRQQPALPRK